MIHRKNIFRIESFHGFSKLLAPGLGRFLICLTILVSSCLPAPLEVNIPQSDPKLVIASQVIPGDFMLVTVTRSFSALKGEEQEDDTSTTFLQSILVRHARVVITHNGQSDTLIRLTPGVYISTITLLDPTTVIGLDVYDSVSNESITAQSTMLPRVPLTEAYLDYEVNGNDTSRTLHYSFNDPSENNWYVVSMLKYDSAKSFVENNTNVFSGNKNYVFEKRYYDKSLPSRNGPVEMEEKLYNVHKGDTLALMFTNISQGYFDFLEARKRSEGLMTIITGEPVNYPTNVRNGYGYFNTHDPDIRVLVVE